MLRQIERAFADPPRPADDQLLHPDARDDTDIQWLYGVAVSLFAERFIADDSAFGRSKAWIAGLVLLLPLGFFGVVGLAVLALILAAVLLGRAAPEIASVWTSPPVAWIGRIGLGAIAIVRGAELVRDVAEIL